MMGKPVPHPYKDVPFRMLKDNWRLIVSVKYVVLSFFCAVTTPAIALNDYISIYGTIVFALTLIVLPALHVAVMAKRIWRDRGPDGTNQ